MLSTCWLLCMYADPSAVRSLQYDNRAEDLTKEVRPVLQLGSELISVCVWYSTRQGMRQGIINSGAVIIFLSAGILSRSFCQFEIREALRHKKTLVLIR